MVDLVDKARDCRQRLFICHKIPIRQGKARPRMGSLGGFILGFLNFSLRSFGPKSTQLRLDIVDQIWEQFKKVLILEHLEKVLIFRFSPLPVFALSL